MRLDKTSAFASESEVSTQPVRRPASRRADRIHRLGELPQAQCGLLRRSQLRDSGWRRDHIEHEVAVGRWTVVAPEVIALQNAPLTYDQRLWLGVLHGGSGSAISHGTACSLAGLTGWQSDVIEVIRSKSKGPVALPGFFFHETRRDYQAWVRRGSLVPALRLEVAALLAAERKATTQTGIGLLAACVQQRLTNADRLFVASLGVSKLRHGKEFRLALGDIAGGSYSFAEIDVARRCRATGLAAPERQHIRLDRDGRRRYLDCMWRLSDGRVVVLEIDGSFHLQTDNWWKDMRRERDLVVAGRIVLRCSSIEIRHNWDQIARDLISVGVPCLW